MRSTTVISVGAVCFGVVIGYITYRTLARKESAALTDIAAVISALGGAAITTWFDNGQPSDSFAWYAIGLLGGMMLYLLLSLAINGRTKTGKVMAAPDSSQLPD
jgi:crotonobetainyl-CoA:carnitine CoA-transferase CaiB-like acyl-CoA transferase